MIGIFQVKKLLKLGKPNVRFVIHYNMPKDLESYYQEAGRAGRDGEPARCVLLYAGMDVRTIRFLMEKEQENQTDLPPEVKAEAAQKAEERLKYMTFYSTTRRCLRGFILQYFGQKAPARCGRCSACLAMERAEQAAAQLEAARRQNPLPRRKTQKAAPDEFDQKLLSALYGLRKRLADRERIPAFEVLGDGALREICAKKPVSLDEFRSIPGVNEAKAARYGPRFVRLVQEMLESRNG